jgi:hypothetical protein
MIDLYDGLEIPLFFVACMHLIGVLNAMHSDMAGKMRCEIHTHTVFDLPCFNWGK